MTIDDADALAKQRTYYEEIAKEYDNWLDQVGGYDPDAKLARGDEISLICRALQDFQPSGNVLEMACGTGQWTKQLLAFANKIVAVDSSPAMLAINAQRTNSARVEYIEADVFSWEPREKFDVVFFGFWLSHVPESRFASFWDIVAASLRPGGRVFLLTTMSSTGDPLTKRRGRSLTAGSSRSSRCCTIQGS
jgi:SAM-dependent methyltransferase